MRSIPKKYKIRIKYLVKQAHKYYHGDQEVLDYVKQGLDQEVFNSWEGANAEIESLVQDFNLEA